MYIVIRYVLDGRNVYLAGRGRYRECGTLDINEARVFSGASQASAKVNKKEPTSRYVAVDLTIRTEDPQFQFFRALINKASVVNKPDLVELKPYGKY